jgi:hypothetical protein
MWAASTDGYIPECHSRKRIPRKTEIQSSHTALVAASRTTNERSATQTAIMVLPSATAVRLPKDSVSCGAGVGVVVDPTDVVLPLLVYVTDVVLIPEEDVPFVPPIELEIVRVSLAKGAVVTIAEDEVELPVPLFGMVKVVRVGMLDGDEKLEDPVDCKIVPVTVPAEV